MLEIGKIEYDTVFARLLKKYLIPRVRLSDVKEWYKNSEIGILLSETISEGALKLTKEIRQKNALTISSPAYSNYMYTSPEWLGENGI